MRKLHVPICSAFQYEQIHTFIIFVGAIFWEKMGGPISEGILGIFKSGPIGPSIWIIGAIMCKFGAN